MKREMARVHIGALAGTGGDYEQILKLKVSFLKYGLFYSKSIIYIIDTCTMLQLKDPITIFWSALYFHKFCDALMNINSEWGSSL